MLMVALNNAAEPIYTNGEHERGAAYFEESLAIRRRLGDRSRIALSLVNVGYMALLDGDLDRAAALVAESEEIASTLGDTGDLAWALGALAWIAFVERRWEDADTHARESMRLVRELGLKADIVDLLFCLAGTAAATADSARAARLAAAGERHRQLYRPNLVTNAELHAPRSRAQRSHATRQPGSEPGQRVWRSASTKPHNSRFPER